MAQFGKFAKPDEYGNPTPLARLRKQHNRTLAELAEDAGVDTSTIDKWEKGKRKLPHEKAAMLAPGLFSSIEELLGLVTPKEAAALGYLRGMAEETERDYAVRVLGTIAESSDPRQKRSAR